MTEPGDLLLTPPEPVKPVPAEKAETLIPLDDATRDALAVRARTYVEDLAALDPRSPEFHSKIGQVSGLGDGEMRASAQAANRMLNRSVAALAGAKGESADAQKRVAGGLVELRRTVEDLDPKDVGKLTGRKLLSKLPFGRSLRDFVSRYQSANVNINKIVSSLRSGQDELRRDMAINHLSDGNESVAEIAAALGFAETSAFHRAFKQWTGVSPGDYRRAPKRR